jgi:hypothetical protein
MAGLPPLNAIAISCHSFVSKYRPLAIKVPALESLHKVEHRERAASLNEFVAIYKHTKQ